MHTISYQLYSSRNWDADETFAMLAEVGYKEVEGVGPHYEDTAATKARLALWDDHADGSFRPRLHRERT